MVDSTVKVPFPQKFDLGGSYMMHCWPNTGLFGFACNPDYRYLDEVAEQYLVSVDEHLRIEIYDRGSESIHPRLSTVDGRTYLTLYDDEVLVLSGHGLAGMVGFRANRECLWRLQDHELYLAMGASPQRIL